MQVTFETVGLALVLALVIGLVAGFRGGRIDYLLMRATDAGLAFPPLVLALAVVAVRGNVGERRFPGPRRWSSPRASPASSAGRRWPSRRNPSSRPRPRIGSPPVRIVIVRILPNVMTGLVVGIAIALGSALLAESGLAFLGLGPPPPSASWGAMLQEAYDTSLFTHPWSLVPAGLTIALTVLAFNTIGDSLRDTISGATAPESRRQRGVKRQRGITAVARPAQPTPTGGGVAVQWPAVAPGGPRPVHRVRDGCRAGPGGRRRVLRCRGGQDRRAGR